MKTAPFKMFLSFKTCKFNLFFENWLTVHLLKKNICLKNSKWLKNSRWQIFGQKFHVFKNRYFLYLITYFSFEAFVRALIYGINSLKLKEENSIR
jgi:hypothetical protein